MTNKQRKIFTLEGDWDKHLNSKTSVKSLLEFLGHNSSIDFAHKNCSTSVEFYNRLDEFVKVSTSLIPCYIWPFMESLMLFKLEKI